MTALGEKFECGDGVPVDIVVAREPVAAEPVYVDRRLPDYLVRGLTVAFAVLGQLAIAAAIRAGADPTVGLVAAVAVLFCGLVLIGAEFANRRR